MKRFCIIGLALLTIIQLQAQQFGGFPPSIKWKQINTNAVRIIFPAAADSQAQQIANIISKIAILKPNSLGSDLRKVNIILHNNTTLANGYVALAPFRSEYYLIPGSNIFEFGANPWYKELAVHEFRHVLQYSNFNKGLSKLGSLLFGEGGQALLNAMAIPNWFWEGDAVHSETALTTQGRGRTPYFYNGFKALWREGRNYNWMKLRNGSLKDYVPDHYELGYLLVNYGDLQYGDDFWRKVTSDAAAYKGLVYPFQRAVKKHSGLNYRSFRQQALDYYRRESRGKRTDTVKRQTVTNYYFPQYIGKDSLLYVKSSYKTLPAFYIKDRNGEHRLRLRNITTENWFSYRKGKIAYTAYETNARWSLIDYSSIYLCDIRTGHQKQITHKTKYFTPDIAPAGNKIVAVFVNEKTETELHLLDMSGKVKRILPAVHHSWYNQPRFVDDSTIVVIERLPNATMQMSLIDLSTEERNVLIPSTPALLGNPFPYRGFIYFVSSVAGIDDIYALRLSDKKVFLAEAGVTGKYYPSVYKDSLVWSAFTSNGLQLNKKAIVLDEEDVAVQRWKNAVLPYPVAGAGAFPDMLASSSRRFPVSRYRQGAHLFNFHSWNPDYTDPEFSLALFSDNVLNTFSNSIFYRYNQNETSHTLGWNSSYGGFFPVLNAGVEYTWNRTLFDTVRRFDINQVEASVGYNIPLDFTSKRMARFLNLGSDYVFNQTSFAGSGKDSGRSHNSYLRNFISWAHYLPKARQHIYPKFGYSIALSDRRLLNEKGFQFLGTSQLFLPSFGNHSVVLTASWQETDTNNVVFSNRFANSRGYDDYYFSRMWRVGANYHFPIAYPDFGFANIVYVQRLRGNVFYDFTKVYSKNKSNTANLRSVGGELYFDTKWWNQLPVSFGFRVSHLLDNGFSPQDKKGNNWFEFILPVNLIQN